MKKSQIIQLPKILDSRGNLTFLESDKHIPFKIARCYWVYDVPGGDYRGGHALKEGKDVIIALSGSFDVIVSNGEEEITHSLNRSYYGLYLPEMSWRKVENFSTNSLALVLSSTDYNEQDYIRNHDDFIRQIKNER